MTTRRNFLKGAAATGIAFCSCGMLDAARAQSRAPRLPVKVGGKRALTIDAHSHCYFHEALNLMGDAADKILPPVKGVPEHFIVIEQRLKEMDAMAIDMEVLSINPFWYGKDRDTAAAIVKLQNEKLAELCASRPERFAAFASLSLQFPDLAVQQLETAIKKQGLRGAAIGGSVLGTDFSDEKFHPVWAKAEELGAVLFIHPQSTPQLAPRFKGNGDRVANRAALRVELNSNRNASASSAAQTAPARIRYVIWYSRDVKRTVKHVRTVFRTDGTKIAEDTYELVKYVVH